uniref:rRNA-processing protein UTP23 homolog n=1 Tax=Glossina morsitans morsitans TaxID=37546 RepID=A0A1B0FIP5_GLOMM
MGLQSIEVDRREIVLRNAKYFNAHYNYREPYQVLIDATFCQAALKNKVIVEEQVRKYFQVQVKLLTTQCIILEAESLGAPLVGATQIVKKFLVHKCGHEGNPIAASECIKQMTKDSRYIVASQDKALQTSLRKVPGRCLLYLHKATPTLETPSQASKKWVQKKLKNILTIDIEKIENLKSQNGINVTEEKPKSKRRSPKNPNPLSCKKSKKQSVNNIQTLANSSKPPMRAKRKRIKLPRHVKEILRDS